MGTPQTVILASVPRSGTLFTLGLLEKCGYQPVPVHSGYDGRPKGLTAFFAHFSFEAGYEHAKREYAKGCPCIIPIRHPYLVAENWRRRGDSVGVMIKAYRRVLEFPKAHILPVDGERRQEALDDIAEATGIPLETRWVPVNSHMGTREITYSDVTPQAEVKEFADEIDGFLSKYY